MWSAARRSAAAASWKRMPARVGIRSAVLRARAKKLPAQSPKKQNGQDYRCSNYRWADFVFQFFHLLAVEISVSTTSELYS